MNIRKITRKSFHAWAESLPKNARLNFWDPKNCPVGRYLQHLFKEPTATFGLDSGIVDGVAFAAPKWLATLAFGFYDLTTSGTGKLYALKKKDILATIAAQRSRKVK